MERWLKVGDTRKKRNTCYAALCYWESTWKVSEMLLAEAVKWQDKKTWETYRDNPQKYEKEK